LQCTPFSHQQQSSRALFFRENAGSVADFEHTLTQRPGSSPHPSAAFMVVSRRNSLPSKEMARRKDARRRDNASQPLWKTRQGVRGGGGQETLIDARVQVTKDPSALFIMVLVHNPGNQAFSLSSPGCLSDAFSLARALSPPPRHDNQPHLHRFFMLRAEAGISF
jgi:hypothetical protein